MTTLATHYDYLEEIGRTAFSARDLPHRRWCKYYFGRLVDTVSELLVDVADRDTVLDLGCSHGSWQGAWRELGFGTIHGVELHSGRAQLAEASGFDHVYNCDAANVPVADGSYGVICSSGVFVHILRREDQIAVIREASRMLKPGGVFIFNFPPPLAYGHTDGTVIDHCAYYSLDTMLRNVSENTDLVIEDVRASFYRKTSRWRRLLHRLLMLPGSITALNLDDRRRLARVPIQESATVYIKARKITH